MVKSPTLGDVARAAKLSAAAVSRHLNGSLQLPPETVRRIEAAVTALHYRPNPLARSLSLGRSNMIGLLLPEIANPFFSQIAAAVEAAADAEGLGVMLCSSLNKQGREIDYIGRLRRNLVDGLLFATNHADDGSLAAAINEAPGVVILDEDVEGTEVPKVFSDNRQGGHLAGAHLIAAGHRRMAYFGGPRDLMSTRERRSGFVRAIRQGGPDCALAFECCGAYSREHGEAALERLLDEHPDVTAVFAASDEITIGLAGALRRRGPRLGADLSVVSFDDVGPLDLLDPPVTAIRQPVGEIGRRAFACVVRGFSGEPKIERLPVELVERSSVMPPRQVKRPPRTATKGKPE